MPYVALLMGGREGFALVWSVFPRDVDCEKHLGMK